MAAPKLPTLEQLAELDRAVLLAHLKDVERAIKESESRAKQAAMEKIKAIAAEAGVPLADLLSGAASKTRAPVAPKYKHPENEAQTWTGRGRKPGWVAAHLDAGGSLEDLAI